MSSIIPENKLIVIVLLLRKIEVIDLTEDQPSKVIAVVVHTSNPGKPPKVKELTR